MALTDLDLELLATGYDLDGVTVDPLVRMRNRWIVQFLSQRTQTRGSTFASQVAAGRVKTNADVVTLFSLTSTQIIQDMRQFAEDIYPFRAELFSFTFIDARTLSLKFTVFTSIGNVVLNLVVS